MYPLRVPLHEWAVKSGFYESPRIANPKSDSNVAGFPSESDLTRMLSSLISL